MAGLIDLHIHSAASDGTDATKELLEVLRLSGIRIFSITDHDTIEGAVEMEEILSHSDSMEYAEMRFIPGIEFSCITRAGKCHILAFDYDKSSEAFQSILEKGREKRRNKIRKRLDFMEEQFGIVLPEEKVRELLASGSVGKPHLGNLLVSMGLAKERDEAISKYINPCRTEESRLDGEEVIRAVLRAGGVPVWAHPYGGTNEKEVSEQDFEKQLDLLLSAGLMGLECFYSKYTRQQVTSLLAASKRNRLLVSGGSDYHGRNKSVPLGKLNDYGEEVDPAMLTVLSVLKSR